MIKNPPAKQEMWVRSLGQEDSLDEEMATQFSVLAWEIHWTEDPGRLQSMGSQSRMIIKTKQQQQIELGQSSELTHRRSLALCLPMVGCQSTNTSIKY